MELNPKTIAEELNVQSILIGRLLQPENKLSIRVELIDTHDNRQLWGNQYDQEFTKILDIQRDIANKISKNLQLKLSTADKNKLEKIYTENSKAYQNYLKGLYQWQKFTVEGFLKSIEYFEQALQIDPNYVLAYVGLAFAYTNLGSFHGEMVPKEAINKAKKNGSKGS
jgi:tetratricopeptide (TPR) repeat protein